MDYIKVNDVGIYVRTVVLYKNYFHKFKLKLKLKLRALIKLKLQGKFGKKLSINTKAKIEAKLKKKLKEKGNYGNVLDNLKSKKIKFRDLLYFLKYFLVFRKYHNNLINLSKVKSNLSKRKLFLKKTKARKLYRYFLDTKDSIRKFKHVGITNVDFYFIRDMRFFRLLRLYDIKKKYIRYLNNNRSIYGFYKYRLKHSYKFIKRHIRSLSILDIKSRAHKYEFSLRNISIKLKYAFTYRNADIFVKSGFIFLNGYQNTNPHQYIYKGDIIELIFSNFIFKLKKITQKNLNMSMRKFKKYNWRFLRNKVDIEKRKLRLSRFSEKILNYKLKLTKVFQFDYRTMSYSIVNNINPRKDLSYLNKKILPIYLLKLFNWKLIT